MRASMPTRTLRSSQRFETRLLKLDLGARGVRTVLVAGQGKPIVLVQGTGASHAQWGSRFLSMLVESGRQVISINHLGVGGSSDVAGRFTTTQLAEDQLLALRHLVGESSPLSAAQRRNLGGEVDLFGISLGGMVAQEMVLAGDRSVGSLTLCSTSGGGKGAALRPDLSTVREFAAATFARTLYRSRQLKWNLMAGPQARADAELFAEFVEIGASASSCGVIARQLRAAAAHDALKRLEGVSLDVRVVHGSEDRIVPVSNAFALSERIATARTRIVERAGHLLALEAPDEVVSAICA